MKKGPTSKSTFLPPGLPQRKQINIIYLRKIMLEETLEHTYIQEV